MKKCKEEKAYMLFDAIGDIDGAIAEQALSYQGRRSSRPKFALLLAACLCMAIVFTSVVSLVMNRSKDSEFLPDSAPPSNGSPSMNESDNANISELEAFLLSKGAAYEEVRAEDIDLFSGNVLLIWQNSEDEGYRVVTVSDHDASKLIGTAKTSGEKLQQGKSPECRVWISYGDGTVISPYLNSSNGNVGYGEIFTYDPEKIPSQSFISCVKSLFG